MMESIDPRYEPAASIIARHEARIAELEAENATLHEICRRWERLTGGANSFFVLRDDGENYVIFRLRSNGWSIESSVKYFGDKLFDSPLAALAAIEAWEKQQEPQAGKAAHV